MCQQDCATPYWEKCASGLYVSGSEFSDAFSVILSLDPEATNIRACESGFQVKLLASVSYTCSDSGSGSGGSCDELVPQSYTTVSDPAQCAFDKSFFKVTGPVPMITSFFSLFCLPLGCCCCCLIACCGMCCTKKPDDSDEDLTRGSGKKGSCC
mmetsp:Transcript_41693/g.111176  ORF Transcript_41693/g.111176 Transcript_41693/m.111176 type:complete len:154 (-) Transcript_41693:287-748(-)